MRRLSIAALVLVAGLAAFWFFRDATDRRVGTEEPEVPAEAPEETAGPGLAAAPAESVARAVARAKARRDGIHSSEEVEPEASLPRGTLTVLLERPYPSEPTLLTRPLVLELRSRDLDVTDVAPEPGPGLGAPKVVAPGDPQIEDLGRDYDTGSPLAVWRVRELPAGTWLVRARADPVVQGGPGLAWRPRLLRTRGAVDEVTLSLSDTKQEGTLRLSAKRGEVPAPCGFEVRWSGLLVAAFASGTAVPLNVAVPPDEDLVVVPLDPAFPMAGRTPSRKVRVPVGGVEEVAFELGPQIDVTIAVMRPGGVPPTRASFAVWRFVPGADADYVATERQMPKTPDKDGTYALKLTPGEYVVLVTDVGPSPPATQKFRVPAAGALRVDVLLEPQGAPVTCLVKHADGQIAGGYSLWLGRLDGPSPETASTALVHTDPEGRADFGPLPDGDYLIADYAHMQWISVRVEHGRLEPGVLTLPPRGVAAPTQLRGRVRTPAGTPVVSGWVSVGPAVGWRRYATYAGGSYAIGAEAGEWTLVIHHSWFLQDRFATWSRSVTVEAGKDQWVDVRLAPR